MPNSSRLAVLLTTAAVLAATLVPSLSASADELPPTPVPTETSAPSEPTPTIAPDDTAPEDTAKATTTTLTGSFVQLSGDGLDTPDTDASRMFRADDAGYLFVDVRGVKLDDLTVSYSLEVTVPEGLDPAADGFPAELATASLEGDPLVVVGAEQAQLFSSMVNQTPNNAGVHKVYAVLVTPSNGASSAAANQTVEKVTAAVAHSDDYWKQQSSGSVRFTLAATVPWYKAASGGLCTDADGSAALWNEATAKLVAADVGYVPGSPDSHVALFLPSGTACDGALGYGSVGYSANTGGILWAVGTDTTPTEKATLAHELGHNLSLGHANWLDCTASNGLSGCTTKAYGDIADVMGYGQSGISGGALSSAHAIRSKIWPSSAYAVAPKGTKSYKLNAVSGNSGLRSVIVEDYYGDRYYVEYRNFTGEDARPTPLPTCTSQSCISQTAGVRILMLEDSDYEGLYGDASLLLGRTVNGAKLVSFTKGQSFSVGYVSIKVTATTSSTATVSISRSFQQGSIGGIALVPVNVSDGTLRVGDTVQAAMKSASGYDWIADSEKFQWYRNGSKISGATSQNYTFTNADFGASSLAVKVTVASKGYTTTVASFSIAPIQKATLPAGTRAVTVQHADPLKAQLANFPRGTTFAYQWWYLKDGVWTTISKATSSTYAPTASDRGRQIKVIVTPTSAGNALTAVESTPEDFALSPAAGLFIITGTQKVGSTLTAPLPAYSSPEDGTIGVTRTFVWYRGTKVVKGEDESTYVLTGADAGAQIKVKVTASAPGYISHTQTSYETGFIVKGTIAGSHAIPVVTKTGTTKLTLTAALPVGSITDTSAKTTYQWYRAGAKISKATSLVYKLTSSDYNKLIWLTSTTTRTGYETVTLESEKVNHSILPTSTPVVTGEVRVGAPLTITLTGYIVDGDPVMPTSVDQQWLRDGKAMSGKTQPSYTPTSADIGKVISVKVTAHYETGGSALLPAIQTSAGTQKIGAASLDGWDASLSPITLDAATMVLTFPTDGSGVTTSPVKTAYQWLRDGKAISGGTKNTFTLTAADGGKAISLRVTISKSGYTTVVKTTTPVTYPALAIVGAVSIDDSTPARGQTLHATPLPTFTRGGDPWAPDPANLSYQWYLDGKAASGATADSFVVPSTAKGKKVTVRLTAKDSGYVPASVLSAATSKVS